jgi:hypothetical protein
MCYTIKCNMKECGWIELITCWNITRVGKKAIPALRVNLEENMLKRPIKANLA